MPNLTINGQSYFADAPPDTPLLWVIREDLRLTGTKYGCGIGACGSCTVHINGEAVRSCMITVGAVDGASITTIEGLSPANNHPVQQAWIDEQVPLCGFCQNGMMIKATELLDQNATPSVAQIKQAFMSGPSPHLCRCGSYTAIIDAVQRAASIMAKGGK